MADRPDDEVLDALEAVLDILEHSGSLVDLANKRAQQIREGRSRGASYAELLTAADSPLVIEIVTELLDGLFEAGSWLRRAEARALYAEGLSMDKISRLLRVSRQRVSSLIRSPYGDGRSFVGGDRQRSLGLSLTNPEFRLVADSLPHITWVAGPDGTTEYFNRAGTDYTGLPAETNYDWNWVTLVHPDDREVARRGWECATETETAFELDYRIRRLDGQFRWHRFRSLPVSGPDGRVSKWIGTATDIDDQKRLEQDLRRAEREASERLALLEVFQASAPVGFAIVDKDFRVVQMNQHLAAVNGAPLEDQMGRTVAQLVPALWPQLEHAFRQVRDTGEAVVNLEVTQPTREESQPRRWMASYYPIVLDADIADIGLVVMEVTA